jgi:hypothetical protein
MPKEYIIYCDESEKSGKHFSNFYGGALVTSDDIDEVRKTLADKKTELNLFDEVKWTKITESYEEKYKQLMACFFQLVKAGKIKIRIMFTQNTNVALQLTKQHVDDRYFILYYHFIKNAFGLLHSPVQQGGVRLRIYPDQIPDTKEQVTRFRDYIVRLARSAGFKARGISIKAEDVSDVCSHDHDVLQCLDVILGAIQFKLNDMHLEKPLGKNRRGKRTRAKERVYKHIRALICDAMFPNFNIGVSTGIQGVIENRWAHPYRHWLFKPTNVWVRPGSKKDKKK